jgi:hypothetical protein
MKRFNAFYANEESNGHLLDSNGELYATEVRFDIIARNEQRALELIDQEGEDSSEFYLEETSRVKDQMGRYFPESIQDARI